jgi:iron complex outermembrane receptor protein
MPQPFAPTALALAAALCLAGGPAAAQTSADAPTQTIVIRASADASAEGLSKPYAGGQVARGGRVGLLGTQDVMETPFASTNFTSQLLQDQQTRSVADVLLNDAGVRNARGFGNFQEVYVIRGFPLFSDDIAYNGLYGLLPRQFVAAELLERVEVFRGASAFLNGAAPGGSGLGGAINLMPKRATNEPLSQVSLGWETGGQAMLGLDLSRRFGPDRSTGVRINAVSRDGNTAVDGESRRLGLLSVGLDWRGDSLRLSADIGHQEHRLDAPRPSVTPNGAVPKAPDAQVNFAQPWTYSSERQTFGTVRGEFDLNRDTLVWAAAGARRGSEANVLALTSANADGSASAYRFDNSREDSVATGEVGLRGKLSTGNVKHQVSLSAARFVADFKNAYAFSDFFNTLSTNLDHPVAVAAPPANFFTGGNLASPLTTQKTSTGSLAIADSMSLLDDAVRINLGARRQTITDATYDYNSGAQQTQYQQARTSPLLGLLWKASGELSVYANLIEGLVRGDVAPLTSGPLTVTNGGQAFAPYQTKQQELGVKFDLGRVGGFVDWFSARKAVGMVKAIDATTAVYVVDDSERHSGFELSVFGELARGFKLLGGASFIDAKLLASGTQAVGVPKQQFNLGAEWTPAALPDLALNARVLHTGAQWADAGNTHSVPSWNRLDLGARWGTVVAGRPLTLRARLDNVFDKGDWTSAGGFPGANYLVLGNPRTLSISAAIDF